MLDETARKNLWEQEAELSALEQPVAPPSLLTRSAIIDQAIEKLLGLGEYRCAPRDKPLHQSKESR